jgi:hypothetical protein
MSILLNVVVEWLTLLLHIREVLGSDVILTEVYHGFTQSLQANAGIVPYISPQLLPSTSF